MMVRRSTDESMRHRVDHHHVAHDDDDEDEMEMKTTGDDERS